jgi:AcrR family transcriptional regulator
VPSITGNLLRAAPEPIRRAKKAQGARLNGPLRVKSREKYDLVLDAAAHLLETRQFEDINVADISAESGVNRTTIYNFFDSIHDIFAALTKRYVRHSDAVMAGLIPQDLPGNIFVRIDAMIDIVTTKLNTWPVGSRCMYSGSRYDAYIVDDEFETICATFYRKFLTDCTPAVPLKDYDPFRTLSFIHASFYAQSIKTEGSITPRCIEQIKLTTRGYLQTVILS